jgi:hypothetical protein
MSAQMDALKIQVQATVDGIGSAIALIGVLSAGKEDTAGIVAVTDQLSAASKALGDAVSPPVAPPVV